MFGEGKYIFLWRRKNREGKGGNNWTRKIHFFAEREGKGGKYLEKENIFEIKYIFEIEYIFYFFAQGGYLAYLSYLSLVIFVICIICV